MKNVLRFVLFSVFAFCAFTSYGRKVKISATPSNAKIYVDGNYYGNGIVEANIAKKDGFIVVKIELEEYVTLETKIYASDKRKAVSYTLRPDDLYNLTSESGLVNKYFTISIGKDYYTTNADGSRNTEKAWKLMHQILLNYFDEIQTTDISSGFIQTPWHYKRMPTIEKMIRTRVSIRDISTDDKLTFQIKVSSELASLLGANNEESYREINRIAKELEPMIGEFQSRLSK